MLLENEVVALARRALGVKVQQLGGRVVHLQGGFLARLLPLAGAQGVELDGFGVGAAVARDQLQLRHRHVELGVVGVFEVEELGVAFAEIHVYQAEVAADAVAFMHHRIAHLQLRQVAQPAFEIGAAGVGAPSARTRRGGIQFVLGNDRNIVQQEAAGKRADAEHEAGFAAEEAGEIEAGFRRQPVFREIVGQRLAPASRFRE